jgi:putative nucleotidyltransferase with HDIG domain
MKIPTKEECFEILKEYDVPQNIIDHSLRVTSIAVFLAKKLVEKGIEIDVDVVERASLLHDLDKIATLHDFNIHGKVSQEILSKKGYAELGKIVFSHRAESIKDGVVESWEEKVVNYADKLAQNDKLVSVSERFEYGRKKYPHLTTPEHMRTEELVKEVEKEIFSHLDFEPCNLEEKMHGKILAKVKITYFVHGTTTDNENNISTGWNQGELSELGIKQSEELRGVVKDDKFDVIFSSDLKRAVDSAKLNFPSQEIIQDKRLRECNYGDMNGMKSSEVEKIDSVNVGFPNGESYLDVEKRMKSFLKDVLKNYSGKSVAIVSHKAPQLALEVISCKKEWTRAIKEDWRNKKDPKAWCPGWVYIVNEDDLK